MHNIVLVAVSVALFGYKYHGRQKIQKLKSYERKEHCCERYSHDNGLFLLYRFFSFLYYSGDIYSEIYFKLISIFAV